jgi:hypothetical protein
MFKKRMGRPVKNVHWVPDNALPKMRFTPEVLDAFLRMQQHDRQQDEWRRLDDVLTLALRIPPWEDPPYRELEEATKLQ